MAPDIAPILSLDTPRPPEQWPDVTPQPVPPFNTALLPPNLPLSVLGKSMFFGILAFEKSLGAKVPDIPRDSNITGAQAEEIIRNMSLDVFPVLRSSA